MAETHAFGFLGGTVTEVDSQLTTDLARISSFPAPLLSELTNAVLGFLKAPGSIDLVDQVTTFAAKHKAGVKPLKALVKSLLIFFRGSLKHGLSPTQLKDDLVHLSVSEERAAQLADIWGTSLVDLSLGAVGESLKVNELLDIEWNFGVTVATDEVESAGATFLQLKLQVDKGGVTESVPIELSLPQFYEFLSEMEKAKSYADFLST